MHSMAFGEWRVPDVRVFDKSEVYIYDLATRELVENIDVIPLFEPFMEEYQLQSIVPRSFEDEAGEIYLGWYIEEIPISGECDPKRYRLILNLRTREVSLYEELPERFAFEEQREMNLQLSIFDSWTTDVEDAQSRFSRFQRINGMDGITMFTTGFPGLVSIRLEATNLPQESQVLYSMFPGLRDFTGQEGLFLSFWIDGHPTAEDILTMFMEDGQEISFEGSIMSTDWSIDGQEHQIYSFEDFFEWVDPERALWGAPTHF
jgi:hypothetical protein